MVTWESLKMPPISKPVTYICSVPSSVPAIVHLLASRIRKKASFLTTTGPFSHCLLSVCFFPLPTLPATFGQSLHKKRIYKTRSSPHPLLTEAPVFPPTMQKHG